MRRFHEMIMKILFKPKKKKDTVFALRRSQSIELIVGDTDRMLLKNVGPRYRTFRTTVASQILSRQREYLSCGSDPDKKTLWYNRHI